VPPCRPRRSSRRRPARGRAPLATDDGSERPAVAADRATLERVRRVRAQAAELLADGGDG
jgi:hypothetical protein